MIDKPDAERKLHTTPIALGGGLAVFIALTISFAATILIDRNYYEYSLGFLNNHRWYVLFFAAFAILVVGLVDDRWALRGRQKLLAQCLIVASVAGSGTIINSIGLFSYNLELGALAMPITMLWLLIAINALNLIDGADGMATTVGCIVCLGLGLISSRSGVNLTGILCFSIAGALAGFFMFNRPPATIYLGDAGSMMIGFFVGVLAIWSNIKESTVLSSAPVAILALPLFDSSAAILRRWLTGRSIYVTDRAHLHHLLQAKYGSYGMLVVVAMLCSLTTGLSFVSIYFNLPWAAGAGVFFVFGLLVLTRSFGYAETRLVAVRFSHFCRSFSTPPTRIDTEKLHRTHSLQGDGSWETIWEPLVEKAQAHDLASLKIDLNLAWLHEGYHASWQSVRMPEKAYQLTMCVPLFTRRTKDGSQISIGRVNLVASANAPEVYSRVSEFIEQLGELSPQIDLVIEGLESAPKKSDSGVFHWPKAEKVLQSKKQSSADKEALLS